MELLNKEHIVLLENTHPCITFKHTQKGIEELQYFLLSKSRTLANSLLVGCDGHDNVSVSDPNRGGRRRVIEKGDIVFFDKDDNIRIVKPDKMKGDFFLINELIGGISELEIKLAVSKSQLERHVSLEKLMVQQVEDLNKELEKTREEKEAAEGYVKYLMKFIQNGGCVVGEANRKVTNVHPKLDILGNKDAYIASKMNEIINSLNALIDQK